MKLLVLLFSQMWIPLAIVLLVSTTISSISSLITNSVRTTHSADFDIPMNIKYSKPASRLYATHKVQCKHHIPDPIIGLSPEAFSLNTEFDNSSKSHTTHLFRSVVHNFDSNRESGFIVQKRSRRSFRDIAQTTVPTSVASRSETFWNVESGVKGTSSSSELLTLYLPTDAINTPSTMSFSQYFEMTQKSDFSSEYEHAVSESMRTSTLAPILSDTEVNTEPAAATTRKEKKSYMILEIYHYVLVQGLQCGVKYSSLYSSCDPDTL